MSSVTTDSSLLPNSPADVISFYQSLRQKLDDTASTLESFVKDTKSNSDRFALQRAVNTPINAISTVAGSHLLDKLHRLLRLLSGNSVDVGNRQVSVQCHPAALLFCKDLLAKGIVKQGEEQVSSNHDSAFAFASIAIGVWCKHPDVGDLILAYFHLRCPYLVPYYIPHGANESREQYYKNLGYKVTAGGDVEQQDKFLRRVSGFTRLYAALIISSPPPSTSTGLQSASTTHPHGIEHAWTWLGHIVNVEPRPDITATVLHEFLAVAGHALSQVYRRQFVKMVESVHGEYLPRIVAVTPSGASGPVTRLESLLKSCMTGRLSPPKGLLSPSFWHT